MNNVKETHFVLVLVRDAVFESAFFNILVRPKNVKKKIPSVQEFKKVYILK